jgi:hypothetical protein
VRGEELEQARAVIQRDGVSFITAGIDTGAATEEDADDDGAGSSGEAQETK